MAGCCCSSRTCSVIAGIYTTLLSLLVLGVFIAFFRIHACDIQEFLGNNGDPTQAVMTFLYIVYFYNSACGSVSVPNVTREITFPDVVEPAERTYIWTVVYIALHAAWLLSSILLISGCSGYTKGRCRGLAYPWIIVTTAVVCCDVATTVIYAMDIEKTKTLDMLLDFIGVANSGGEFDDIPEYITSVPSITMVVIFAKLGVLWLLTVCCLLCVSCSICERPAKSVDRLFLQTRPPAEDFYHTAQHNHGYMMDERGPYESDEEVAANRGGRHQDSIPGDYIDYSPRAPETHDPGYIAAVNRDPRYERYLETLKQETPPVRAHVPWSYLRPNSPTDPAPGGFYEMHTPPPSKHRASHQNRPVYDSDFVITQNNNQKRSYY